MSKPIRQCIACRKRVNKCDLLRVVRSPKGDIAFDPKQRKQGRGIYICRNVECIQNTRSRDLIGQAFERHICPSVYLRLAEEIKKTKKDFLGSILGFAARSHKLLIGVTATEQGVKRGKVKIIVLDAETRPSTRKRIEALSLHHKIPIVLTRGGESVEKIIGKVNCRCVGVTHPEFARSIHEQVKGDSCPPK